jgi:concentrative nucleoside transporter, CNT family
MFAGFSRLMLALQDATAGGARFVFGYLAGGPQPFTVGDERARFILALQALPLVIVVSALTRVLTHWRILPWVVRAISRALERLLGIGGALGLAAGANVFAGMTEAPLLVRPYLAHLSRGELFALMSTGMATIAGTVFVLYATILEPVLPGAAGHLLAASLMSLPAALAYSLLLVPSAHATGAGSEPQYPDHGTFDALTNGATQGLALYLNIVAMLLVMVALVHLVNQGLGSFEVGGAPLTLERLLGLALAPLAWLLGIPAAEAGQAGQLLGSKVVLNELVAYLQMAALPDTALSAHSRLILTYALCGFANFGSLGVLVGGLGLLVPERRQEILALGLRSIAVGMLATCTTGAIIGLLA